MKSYYKDVNGIREWFKGVLVKGEMQIINPTPEMLAEEGWIEHTPSSYVPMEEDERLAEIERLKEELADTDYIALKAFEGEDISQYGDWKGRRHAIRERINELQYS